MTSRSSFRPSARQVRERLRTRRAAVIISAGALAAVVAAATGTALASGGDGSGSAVPVRADAVTTPLVAPATPSSGGIGPGSAGGGGGAERMSAEHAGAIALREAGGGSVTAVEREIEHGAELWKVDVLRDGTRHRFEVDALTGQARRVGDDRGRAGNGHGADDRPGDDRRGRSGDNG